MNKPPAAHAPSSLTAAETASTRTHHFAVMDGLRGVAAMAVVVLHSWRNDAMMVNGQLAVDLFFLLSGFVIAHAYDDRLRTGMPVRAFLLRRWIRLYPLIFVGAVGGVAIALIHDKTDPARAYPIGSLLSSGALSVFVLPYLAPHISEKAFSFDIPLWSMFFEIAANLVYVVFARYLTKTVLALLVVAGLIGIVVGGPLGGFDKANFAFGFARVACGFFGGVLLFRLRREGRLPTVDGNFFMLAAVLVAVFAIPRLIGGWAFLPVFAVFVAVIVCAAGARAQRADRYFILIGALSYPIYLLHWLTLYTVTWAGTKAGLVPKDYDAVSIAHLLLLPVFAWFVVRFYETPVRNALTRTLRPLLAGGRVEPAVDVAAPAV
jgi:peptidoglycan/LPS O-acetylase OafA/YrhL